jgi:hypothetical protein
VFEVGADFVRDASDFVAIVRDVFVGVETVRGLWADVVLAAVVSAVCRSAIVFP